MSSSASGSTSAGRPRAPPGWATSIDPLDVLRRAAGGLRRACRPTSSPRYRAALGDARAAGARRAAERRSSRARPSTSRPTAGSSCIDDCARHPPPRRRRRGAPAPGLTVTPPVPGRRRAAGARIRPVDPTGSLRRAMPGKPVATSAGRARARCSPSLVGAAGSVGDDGRRPISAPIDTRRASRRGGRRCSSSRPTTRPAENYLLVGLRLPRRASTPTTPTPAPSATPTTSSTAAATRSWSCAASATAAPPCCRLPRDLWVPIAGTDAAAKINSAYNEGPQRLVADGHRRRSGIPIHHYVEIDFVGFKKLVDDDRRGRDLHRTAGPGHALRADVLDPGCHDRSTASQALAYARSRYYEEWIDGEWHVDGTADLGRIERQQLFIRTRRRQAAARDEERPVQGRRAASSAGDVGGHGRRRASTRSRRPPRCARPPRSG